MLQKFKKIISDDIALQYRASLVFCRYSYVITHLNSADRVSEVGSSPQAKFFGDFEPPKRDFPYKNSVFDDVFKGKNSKIGTKKLSFLRNPPLLKIRDK